MELGIHTAELENLQRLTPDVIRCGSKNEWHISYDADFPANDATEANSKYCLDRAIAIILKKQEHSRAARARSKGAIFDPPPVYLGRTVYKRPDTDSDEVHVVSKGFTYQIIKVVSGFDPSQIYYELIVESDTKSENDMPKEVVWGFLQMLPEDS